MIFDLVLVASLVAGCESPPSAPGGQKETPSSDLRNPPSGFGPARIGILPLTELTDAPKGQSGTQLTIYLSILDAFGSQIKAPGVLRFELYEYVQRSAQTKGQRLAIWPDIDLTNPSDNQKYWRDFLRAYEFTLPAQAPKGGTYVLVATCMSPAGRRLSAEFTLKPESP